MSRGNFPRADKLLHRLGQFQEPDRVRNMRPTLADDLRDLFLRSIKVVHKRKVARRLFDRIEIGALDVFDNGELKRLRVVRFDHGNWHVVKARALRGAPPSLAGDDFEVVALERANDDRLNDASLADGCGKLVELIIREQPPRVSWIGLQVLDWRTTGFTPAVGNGGFVTDIANQRSKTASQSRVICHRRS